jgi:hypothetical protein
MRRIVMSVLGCVMPGLAGIGCANQDGNNSQAIGSGKTSEAEMAKQAIQAVLKEKDRIGEVMGPKMRQATGHSHFAQVLGVYFSQVGALDLSKCPTDFRIVYIQWLQAGRKYHETAQQMPDGFGDALSMWAMSCLVRGELDGGASRVLNDRDGAFEQSEAAWRDLEKISVKYNAVP